MNPHRARILVVVFIVQAVVLVGITALHGVRIADGTRVLLSVVPVDPIDLARGPYVDLRYDLDAPVPPQLHGRTIYVELRAPAADGAAWTSGRVVGNPDELDDPDAFIQLYADSDGTIDTDSISTYYLSGDGAEDLERELADGGLAEVVLSSDGSPILDNVRG